MLPHEKYFSEYNKNKEFDKRTIVELSSDVINAITQKIENIEKGMGDIMGGALIETEARTILNQGIDQNKRETALRMIQDGELPNDKIAKYSGLAVTEVERLKEQLSEPLSV